MLLLPESSAVMNQHAQQILNRGEICYMNSTHSQPEEGGVMREGTGEMGNKGAKRKKEERYTPNLGDLDR